MTRASTITNFPSTIISFAAALEKVRPGGLLMFITSRGTMDKMDSTLREMLSDAHGVAWRNSSAQHAFKKNADTEVTTDIVMLRKLRPGETPRGPAWKETVDPYQRPAGEVISINEYFAARSGNDAR